MTGKPGNYALGSIESRTAARAMLERIRSDREENAIIVRIEHIGHDQKDSLPPPRRIVWEHGVTEIVHVAGSSS
jgi:hypothetical protein